MEKYEDRTPRFFPPAPKVPRMPGLVSGDSGFMEDSEESFQELTNSSHRHFNILISGDQDGNICFTIFGIFPIGKVVSHFLLGFVLLLCLGIPILVIFLSVYIH